MLHQPVCALCPIPWINGRNPEQSGVYPELCRGIPNVVKAFLRKHENVSGPVTI